MATVSNSAPVPSILRFRSSSSTRPSDVKWLDKATASDVLLAEDSIWLIEAASLGLFLSVLVWLIGLTEPVITVKGVALSWRDIILIAGGMFLIAKATHEIHGEVEAAHGEHDGRSAGSAFFWVIMQIIVIDLVFSLDSIITAVGMTNEIPIMVAAVLTPAKDRQDGTS